MGSMTSSPWAVMRYRSQSVRGVVLLRSQAAGRVMPRECPRRSSFLLPVVIVRSLVGVVGLDTLALLPVIFL